MAKKQTTQPGPLDRCPECKLILNGLGLQGSIAGVLAVRDSLNKRGRDFSPALLEKLCSVVCGAHDALTALEPELIKPSNTVALTTQP